MKTTFTREFYRPGEGYVEYKPNIKQFKNSEYYKDGLFEVWVNKEMPIAYFFKGKQAKPVWAIRFKDNFQMKEEIDDKIGRILAWEAQKAARRKEKKEEVNDVKVGDLFVYSWGYEQTNVDFYQCTERKGKKMVFRPIAGVTVEDSMYAHGMACDKVAWKNHFLKDEERFPTITKYSLSMDFGRLRKTTETEPHYCSWYA